MFSSKLRSWMENHIVRPRKKSSKSGKNSLSAAASGSSSAVDTKKSNSSGFNVYHSSNGLSRSRNKSPATVSANHGSMAGTSSSSTTGGGCSSVLSSPARRREVSPIQTHTPSRYGWQSPDNDVITSPKSDNYLHASPQTKSPRSQFPNDNITNINTTTSTTHQESGTKVLQQHQQQHRKEPPTIDCSSSSISSLSWSTGSKEPVQIRVHPVPSENMQNLNESSNEPNDNAVHYEEIYTLLRNPVHTVREEQQRANKEMARPKSDQLTHLSHDSGDGGKYCHGVSYFEPDMRQQNDNSKHYGKLLPSRITNTSAENLQHYPPNGAMKSMGVLNAHHRTSYPLESGVAAGLPHPSMARSKNNSMPTVQAVAPMHSLSSPESAYSSYSDGTSPGTSGGTSSANVCQYTPPEYYINMRSGVHYFPKNANSLAIEAHRYKISLNKIEEMSPIDPLPKTSFSGAMDGMSVPGSQVFLKTTTTTNSEQSMHYYPNTRPPLVTIDPQSPRMLRQNASMLMPTSNDFEYKLHTSPSPRQRSRIRTNPWYCTTDAVALPSSFQMNTSSSDQSKSDAATRSSITCSSSSDVPFDVDSTTVCSAYLDNSHFEPIAQYQSADGRNLSSSNSQHKNSGYTCTLSEEETSSSTTEVENFKNTVKRKHHHHQLQQQNLYSKIASKLRHHQHQTQQLQQDASIGVADTNSISLEAPPPPSDDDATLNEMMGKFDESYVYEKETDILSSDSDPTDCPSELDTGQDAGDECDTDELLDIDFIDTSSIQEVHERKEFTRNDGNCSYYNAVAERDYRVASPLLQQQFLKRSHRKSALASGAAAGNCRRKRFMKTRKKSVEARDPLNSPARKSRETRSVGGTPICLRKKTVGDTKRFKTTPLSNRSSSLVFTDMPRAQYRMTVAESEKALIKADLEADVKYRQLILEAESILVSLKSSVQSIPRDTPLVSPRRINPLSNKRVEMLKNSEAAEPKRDLHKQQQREVEQELVASLHKRIEMLKYESSSAPNSPKLCRLSPRKTHLTNFIQQNISSDSLPRKSSSLTKVQVAQAASGPVVRKATASPLTHRRVRSHSSRISSTAAKLAIDSDSEPEHSLSRSSKCEPKLRKHSQRNNHYARNIDDYSSGSNSMENFASQMNCHGSDRELLRHLAHMGSTSVLVSPRPGFVDTGAYYIPQSEPVKRKTYNFGHIKQGVDLESEIPKQALLSKIHLLRRERYAQLNTAKLTLKSSGLQLNYNELNDPNSARNSTNCINKKQLILNTIADLKRNLEEQSVELNGLNDN